MFSNPELFVSRLLFVGLVIEAIETVRLRHAFADGGIFSRSATAILIEGTRWQVRAGATLGGSSMMTAVMICQASAAVGVILIGTSSKAGIALTMICLVTNSYLRARRQIGGSGAEQLTFIVLVTFAFMILAGGSAGARRIADAFIAAQVVLAYFASGVAKVASPIWRDGEAMAAILSTEGYGIPSLARLLKVHPGFDQLLCWLVIGWEIGFACVLVAPKPLMIVFFSGGVLFHLSCAVTMGLNRFIWAFCGCYPAVWQTAMFFK